MKKFFAATILALTLLVVESPAQAMPVQLYDHSVDYVINDLRTVCREFGISLWGTEYYTYKGARRCELHFGNSDNNTIQFLLNDDDSIAGVFVTSGVTTPLRAAVKSGFQAGIILETILRSVGMSKPEANRLAGKACKDLFDAFDRNPYIRQHNEKISVRCPRIRRCVVVDYEFNSSSANFYIYAPD